MSQVKPVVRYEVNGNWLYRWRRTRRLSLKKVCDRLNRLGYAWYPMKLMRVERKVRTELSSDELAALAAVYNIRCEDLLHVTR